MEVLLEILLFVPIALWGIGGFKMEDLAREWGKIAGWYVVIGIPYIAFF